MTLVSDPSADGPPADLSESLPLVGRLLMCASSYGPMLVILGIRFDGLGLRLFCFVLAGIGLLYLAVALIVIPRTSQPRTYQVSALDDAGGEVAGYLASYLLPFVTVSSPSGRDLVGYAIYGVVIAAIFVRSNLSRINPTLYVLGYRVASVTIEGTGRRYLICRRLPRTPQAVDAVDVGALLVRTRRSADA